MKYRRELALLVAAAAFGLFLAEVGLRLHHAISHRGSLEDLQQNAAPPPPGTAVFLGQILKISSEPLLVYQMLPDLDVRFRGVPLRTNSEGWREDETPTAKPPGTLRVAGLGDSVMFGWGVTESKRYMDRLEDGLNRAHPSRTWQSVTLAAPGYNVVMEVEALEQAGLQYSPDLIVLGFSINDFCLPNFVVPRRSIWSLDSFLALYLGRGRTATPRLVERLNVLLEPSGETATGPRGPEFFSTYCSPDNVPAEFRPLVGAESVLGALEKLVRIGRDRGIPVVFLHHGIGQGYVPLGEPDEHSSPEVARALAAVKRMDGLVVADLTRDFLRLLEGESDRQDFVLSPTDPHPSVRGHRQIARLLQRFLTKQGILDQLAAKETL